MTLTRPRTIPLEAYVTARTLPPMVRVTAEGLRMHADDHGRGRAELRQILADVWPETSEVTESVLVDHLLLMAEAGLIVLYEDAAGRECYAFTSWGRVDRANPSTVPEPPPFARPSRDSQRDPRETFAAGEREGAGERESESAGEGGREAHSLRMSREELPPDPFCPDHPDATLEPCIACQNARLRNRRFLDRRRLAMRQEVSSDDVPW